MAKAVWKDLIPVGDTMGTPIITSRLLPHVEFDPRGLVVWFETPQDDPAPQIHTLHVVLTGQMFPDSWQWVATARGPDGYVGHLYVSHVEPY